MAWRFHGRAEVDPDSPRAFSTCMRCGALVNFYRLHRQKQYSGRSLLDLHLYVCDRCLDTPAPFLRTPVLPPDPPPVFNPSIEPYSIDETDYRILENQTPGQIPSQTQVVRETEDGTNQRITEENTSTTSDSNN